MMLNIVLHEPEIPQNTGNIARTCACTGSRLHLIEPLGFDISEKSIKRAGLDYWDKLDLSVYKNLDEFFAKNSGEYYFCTTKAKQKYTDVPYPDGCYLFFGKETKGLPESLIFADLSRAVRIPMREGVRSLNLSNSVAIVLYEALRQHGFYGSK
ncbi:MAG: tRNA (cytidine(34)-2'-O)-methyltransferase [Firmicutes bacterium]|nr:tRNA (cytidine(34)-2'-O)-methyltransferase [Bacillota bacterium]